MVNGLKWLCRCKGYVMAAFVPLVLFIMVSNIGVHSVPSPIHGLSAWVLHHSIVFACVHIVVLWAVIVYLNRRVARIRRTRVLSPPEQRRLQRLKMGFIAVVVVMECVFMLQVLW